MKHIFIFVAVICLPHVSGEDACPCVTGSNCHEDCTLVNIAPQATSNFTSGDNNAYTITGQAAWVTDGVTSGNCASVSSLYPVWKAEFGLTRTVNRIKIFWEGQQGDIHVFVGNRICHTPDSNYTWMSEYTLVCVIPLTGSNLLMYRQPTGGMLSLSLCEVEIYVSKTSIATTTENDQAPGTTLNTTYSTQVTTASDTTSTETTTLLITAPVTTSSPKISKEITKQATTAPATTTAITSTKITTLITTPAVTTTSPITSAGIPTPGCRTTCTCACDYAALTTAAVLLFVAVVVICATTVTITLVRKRQGTTRINSEKSEPCYSEIMLKDLEGDHIYGSLCHEKNRSGKGSP